MNHVILLGRLARDPEGRAMQNGEMCASFTIAVDRPYKDSTGKRPADFIRCSAFRKTAELVLQYFKKGNPIGIYGSLQVRQYQDRDGNNKTVTEVNCANVYFPPSKSGNSDSGNGGGGQQEQPHAGAPSTSSTPSAPPADYPSPDNMDDLPF